MTWDWPAFLLGWIVGAGGVAVIHAAVVGTILRRTIRGIERNIARPYDAGFPCPCQRCNATEHEALHAVLPPCPRTLPQ